MALELSTMLTLSTAHISKETLELIDRESDENNIGVTVYPKAGGGEVYGYFVYFNKDRLDEYTGAPNDLISCLRLARNHNASIICFDSDGPILENQKTYDHD